MERLAAECQRPEYRAPCKPGQKWECVAEGGRWRKHKCKSHGRGVHFRSKGGFDGHRPLGRRRHKCSCSKPGAIPLHLLNLHSQSVYLSHLPPHVSSYSLLPYLETEHHRQSGRRKHRVYLRNHQGRNRRFKSKLHRDFRRDRRFAIDEERNFDIPDPNLFEKNETDDFEEPRENLEESKPTFEEEKSSDTLNMTAVVTRRNGSKRGRGGEVHQRGRHGKTVEVPTKVPEDDMQEWSKKQKEQEADLGTQVDSMMENIRQELHGLQFAQHHHQHSQHFHHMFGQHPAFTDQIKSDNGSYIPPACSVTPSGGVNCSRNVYQNAIAWRRSKANVEEQIRSLRVQLDGLKEIRRHLREKRPMDIILKGDDDYMDWIPKRHHSSNHSNGTGNRFSTPQSVTIPGDRPISITSTASSVGSTDLFDDSSLEAIMPGVAPSITPATSAPRRTKVDDGNIFNLQRRVTEPPFHREQHHHNSHRNNGRGKNKGRMGPPLDAAEPEDCYCEVERDYGYPTEEDLERQRRRRLKEERIRRKERKLRRKAKMEDKECISEKMNCFSHDNDHWRTAPYWTDGPFCFCMNANNNTYWCLRTINATHNFLFCEFVTGLLTFYNLRIDPFEQWNRVHSLTPSELASLKAQLEYMKGCRGSRQCGGQQNDPQQGLLSSTAVNPHPMHSVSTRYKKRKFSQMDLSASSAYSLAIGQSDLTSATKRKKLPKSWRNRKAWKKKQWRHGRQRRRRYRQQ